MQLTAELLEVMAKILADVVIYNCFITLLIKFCNGWNGCPLKAKKEMLIQHNI
jgi:hypothetical protein